MTRTPPSPASSPRAAGPLAVDAHTVGHVAVGLVTAGLLAVGLVGCTAQDDAAVTVPRGDTESAVLQVTGGAASLTVSHGADPGHLLEAEAAGAEPVRHSESDGTHVVDVEGDSAAVRLADDVTWEVRVEAGADDVDLDLAGTTVSRVVLSGGAASIALSLGDPDGVVVIEEAAGADHLALRRPAEVGVRVDVTAGVGQATVDGTVTEGVGSGTTLTTDGFDDSRPSYELTVTGGLGTLDVAGS